MPSARHRVTASSTAAEAAPILSAVLPNYNHAKLIQRALEALYAQELQPDEVIVVDDGSTDDSLAVITAFAERHASLRVLASPTNTGAIAALTRGLAAARGTYVYFAAADDWVMPGFFTMARRMLDRHPDSGLFCGEARIIDGDSGRILATRPPVRPIYRAGVVDSVQARRLLRRMDNWILTGSTVFRRAEVLAAGGFDERLGSFADGYLARAIALEHGFCFAPQVVATWCVYPNSYSRKTALDLMRALEALKTLPDRLAKDPTFPTWYAEIFAKRWRFGAARLAILAEPMDRELLLAMAARSRFDKTVLKVTSSVPISPLARLTTLAWLWFRLRPTTLAGLVRTVLARRMERAASTSKNTAAP
jgi:glycosyltransferase involved in cell wall biosynthesis